MSDVNQSVDVIAQTVRQLGFEVAHTHEDLIFISQNQFIFKQTDAPHMIDLYFNEQLEEKTAEALMGRIEKAGLENSLMVFYKGAYCITEDEDQSLSVEFFNLADT